LLSVDWARQAEISARTGALYQADYYFFIDIVGTCNLLCPSCPVGNFGASPLPKGLMSIATYKLILEKIEAEYRGQTVFIDLYNWGEAPLHPELPKIITATRNSGFGCGISTNLNSVADMRGMVKANPSYIRISLSGNSNRVYQQTHRAGDIFEVKGNMYRLRAMLDRYGSEIPVQVGYHVYTHNVGVEYDKMAELCDELGFLFAPSVGILQPLEKAIPAASSEIGDDVKNIVDLMIIKPHEWKAALHSERGVNTDCIHRRARTTINYDGSVALCCYTYSADNMISSSFLEVAEVQLRQKKYKAETCKTCFSNNLDMMITGVRSAQVNNLLIERIAALRASEGLSMERFQI
jgi:MoaA/NifB/PqqE/SkfB family radical SAM enzyme